jgi:DNA invertase Pin-like site-specific DNA recombinase
MRHQGAGIAKAKANGVCKGRPVSLDHNEIRPLRSQDPGATEIAKQRGCSRDR